MAIKDKEAQLEFRRAALEGAYNAYLEIQSGQAQSYTIGSRTITKHNIEQLYTIIQKMEKEVESLENEISRGSNRCAVAVIPTDW